MVPDKMDIKKELRKRKVKVTRHREEILALFDHSDHHLLTASDIEEMLGQKSLKINPSTIYRNLELLVSVGLLRQISLQDGVARYELVTSHHHHHLICTECHRMEIVAYCPFQEISEWVSRYTNFTPVEHRFEIYGICHQCHSGAKDAMNTEETR